MTDMLAHRDGLRARSASHRVEITDVILPPPDRDNVRASCFEPGEAHGLGAGYAIGLDGWLVSERAPLEAIEVSAQGTCLWRLRVNVRRPDVNALHPDVEWSLMSGFYHSISALKLPTEFEIEVEAVLHDGTRTSIATVRGRRRSLPAKPSKTNPVIVTTLGRTGSTRLIEVLGRHREIVAFRPFEYEGKLVRYWTDVLGALSEPASYRQNLSAELYGPDWWIGTERVAPPATVYDVEMEEWLAGPSVEELAALCKTRIDRFYDEAATLQGKQAARYFAEKILPGTFSEQVLPELYPGAKEIFLVRDFRDMAASILAYERKLYFSGFMRASGASDEDFLRGDLRRDVGLLTQSWTRRSSSALLVRYEDLVLEPEATVARLLDYLDLDRDDAVIDEMLRVAGSDVTRAQHQTSPSAAKSIGRWRREEPSIKAACMEAFADLLEPFGYAR